MATTLPDETILVGLVGSGIGGSLTPAMHEREGARQGIASVYRKIDLNDHGLTAADTGTILDWAGTLGFTGLNITHPCKSAVIQYLDEVSPAASRIGAVNTVVFSEGRSKGFNTDYSGFVAAYGPSLSALPHRRVALVGAGGAGSAAAFAAMALGLGPLHIFDHHRDKTQKLVDALRAAFGADAAHASDDLADAIAVSDGVIQATQTGMARYPGVPVPTELLRPAMWVVELVYVPLRTQLLVNAERLGCRVLGGGDLAVYQAVEAFKLFTGRAGSAEHMRAHFASMIG
jgi:shikimate dehydrogenase